jgi:predicted dehydrogenase
VISAVGYNHRWAPLVRYAAHLIADERLGEITNYRGRFISMYGSDPLGVRSWRFRTANRIGFEYLQRAL